MPPEPNPISDSAYVGSTLKDESDEGEEDEGVPPEPNPSGDSTYVDCTLKDEIDEGEEEDELAEYGLDKYDEEDTGAECNICASYSSFKFDFPVKLAKGKN